MDKFNLAPVGWWLIPILVGLCLPQVTRSGFCPSTVVLSPKIYPKSTRGGNLLLCCVQVFIDQMVSQPLRAFMNLPGPDARARLDVIQDHQPLLAA